MMRPLPLGSKSGLNEVVELLQEARTIPLFKRGRASCYISHVAEIGRQLSIRERTTDGFFRENTTFRVQYLSAFLKASGRKQNVSRHRDVVFFDMVHNPIIRSVGVSVDNDQLKQPVRRNPHPGVGYDIYFETVPKCYAKDFTLHRASVGINVNFDQ
jgi:hypothetical protein